MTTAQIKAQIKYHEDYIKWYCKGRSLARLHRRDIKELKAKLKAAEQATNRCNK